MKRILIVGGNSKLARKFIDRSKDKYDLHATYRNLPKASSLAAHKLDLVDSQSVKQFLDSVKDISFDGVLFFASTFSNDMQREQKYEMQIQQDMLINALAPYQIARNLTVSKHARCVFFGDSIIGNPRAGYHSYSLSKHTMEYIVMALAIERRDELTTICFRLGPTMPPEDLPNTDAYFYDRTVIRVPDVPGGLLDYLEFLIDHDNLSVTGAFVDYDGGFYLKNAFAESIKLSKL